LEDGGLLVRSLQTSAGKFSSSLKRDVDILEELSCHVYGNVYVTVLT